MLPYFTFENKNGIEKKNMNVKLVKIETRTRRESWYRVDIDETAVGLVTKIRNSVSDRNPWKAYLGIGIDCTFLGVVYGDRQVAVDAVVAAHKGVDMSWDKFEKSHGIDAVIPAWKAGAK